ncbi:MAG: hypothetical protein ABIP51_16830, partial [Bacteroidia bacterium]
MKKILLLIPITFLGLFLSAQTTTSADNINAKSSLIVAGQSVTGIQKDTSLSSDMKLPTSKQVADFVSGRLLLKANLLSPVFSGAPTTPTPLLSDSSLTIINSAWAQRQYGSFTPNLLTFGGNNGKLTQDANLYWNNLKKTLGVGATPDDSSYITTPSILLGNGIKMWSGLNNDIYNLGFGFQTLASVTSGSGIGIGYQSLSFLTTGAGIGIGFQSLYKLDIGSGVGIGNYTLSALTSGVNNSAFGSGVMRYLQTGSYNTGMGTGALGNIIGGSNRNTGVGSLAGYGIINGSYGTFIGEDTRYINDGSYSTIIGNRAGYNSTGDSLVLIGFQAGYNSTGNNKLVISNSSTLTPLVFGDFGNKSFVINGGASSDTASAYLSVQGTQKGFLPPRGTTAQMNAIIPVSGLLFFNSDTASLFQYTGVGWQNLRGTGTLGGGSGLVSDVFGRTGSITPQTGDYTFSQIIATPTSLSGYGILDAYPLSGNPSNFLTATGSAAGLTSFPILNQNTTGTATNITGILNGTSFPALTGDITTSAGSLVTAIGSGKVTNTMLFGGIDLTTKVTNILPIGNGGTGFSTYTTGDLLASGGTNSLSKVSGNITTTKKFLVQTGNGSVSALPTWGTILNTDISGLGALATLSSIDLGSQVTGTLLSTNFGALIGDVSNTAGSYSTTIGTNVVSFAKMQQIATASLLGRSTAGTGNIESITLGSGLTLVGGVLNTSGSGSGVSSISIASANGFSGSATSSSTPIITLTTSITGLIKGSGGSLVAAIAGTDYLTPTGSAAGLTSFPTLNQNTTGTASNITSVLTAASFPSLTGDVTTPGGSLVATIGSNKVTYAKMVKMASGTLIYRKSPGNGDPEANTLATLKTDLGLTGTNSGNVTLTGQNYLSIAGQVVTVNAIDLSGSNATGILAAARHGAHTGDVTTPSGSYVTTISNNVVTFAKMQQISSGTLLGRSTSGLGNTEAITIGSGLNLAGGVLSSISSGGSVTDVAVVSINGLAGSVANSTTTPTITLSTTVTSGSMLKAVSGSFAAAMPNTDYLTPTGSAANLTSFPLLNQNTTGNAATATNLVGLTTTVTTLNNVSGTNSGDNAVNSLYSGLVSNATHTGDATGATALTVKGINGVLLSGLTTGLLKNTNSTGIPSIAVAGTDYLAPNGSAALLTSFPTLNQNTTGTSDNVTGIVAINNGGTGQATKQLAFDALSPTTTLGDLVYHNGTNNARIPGNTTASKKFLSQVGTGTGSAAPFWGSISNTDISGLGSLATASSVDLSTASASGILAAGRFPALSGDITTLAGSLVTTISPNAVTYSKMQSMTANKLLGSGLSGTAVSEITLGTGLSFTGNTLNVLTTGGTVTTLSIVSANGFNGSVLNP